MGQPPPSPVKTLAILSLAGMALIFSNCSTAEDQPAHPILARKPKPDYDRPAPAFPTPTPAAEIHADGIDRKERVASQLTPNEALSLANQCVRSQRSNFQNFVVTNVSLNLNLGLQTDSNQTKIMWIVTYKEMNWQTKEVTADSELWVYIDDTTRTAKFRAAP
ncbi:MAG: hypothetical protein ABI222_13905 [Opitutaceae bacterium]